MAPAILNEIEVGDEVRVTNPNLMSYMTKGEVVGITPGTHESDYALVQWLNGAPPLRIKASNLEVIRGPVKFWMVVGAVDDNVNTRYQHNHTSPVVLAGFSAPTRKFYDKQEAINLAHVLSEQGTTPYIVMEAMEVTRPNGSMKGI